MTKPPLRIVGAGDCPPSTGEREYTVEQWDSLNNAECRIRFLHEVLAAIDPTVIDLSKEAWAGFCLVLGDVGRELAARSKKYE